MNDDSGFDDELYLPRLSAERRLEVCCDLFGIGLDPSRIDESKILERLRLREAVDLSQRTCSCGAIDEWAGKCREFFDMTPLADDNFEKFKLAKLSSASDGDVPASSDSDRLSAVRWLMLRSRVITIRDDWNPILIRRCRVDIAWRPLPTIDYAARVSRIGDIRSDLRQDMGHAESVSIDIESHPCWL